LQAARAVQTRYNVSVIATLDTDGALALLLEHSYRIPPLTVPLISAAGAGDAVLAGIAASIARNEPIEQGLRLGIAAAAAVCMRLGTAECRREDVEALLPHVRLEDIAL
jgi:fructose-1-phosphate kinase PfkB-like protein